MNSRLFNLFLIAIIIFLGINLFFGSNQKPATPIVATGLQVSPETVTLPIAPHISWSDPSGSGISFVPCQNLTLVRSGAVAPVLTFPAQSPWCQTVSFSGQTGSLSIRTMLDSLEPRVSSLLPGEYTAELKLADRIYRSNTFTINEPGVFISAFRSLFYAPVYNFFVWLISMLPGHSLGWAIVIITIIIRLILLFPQHQMMLSSRKMQKIQPQIKQIQETHKGDQAKIGMSLMELYKKEGVNPLGSCLPLLIQIPLLIGLYYVVSSITDSTNYYYLYSSLQSFATSEIDSNFLGLNLLSHGGLVGWALALVVGLVQWYQMYLSFSRSQTPESKAQKASTALAKKASSDDTPAMPDPEMMQKMMLYMMPAMIVTSTYFFPVWVGIYWLISGVFTLVQQSIVNRVAK